MLSWYPNSTLHCVLQMQPWNGNITTVSYFSPPNVI
jgi:hypothetical protein